MCIQTIYIRKHQQEVPCGRCYQCVKRRRNDWYIRCLLETYVSPYTYFGLLTYAQVGMKLEKRDVQLFLKRLRIKGYKFKYLIAGEHGEQKDRPHWHCLFFSKQPISFTHIAQSWRGGYESSEGKNKAGWIRFEPIKSSRSIRYTVKYIYKYDGRDPRFSLLISKRPAIASHFIDKYQTTFLTKKSASFTINGKNTAMPRYFKRKIFDDYPDIKEEVNASLAAKVAELEDKELSQLHTLHPTLSLVELKLLSKQLKDYYNEQVRSSERTSKKRG